MEKMKHSPKKISRPEPYLLQIEWQDGHQCTITIENFRRECPCAECKGEEINGKVILAPMLNQFKPGMYDLVNLQKVGNYAITATWGDEHDTGIYNWDYLREICEKHNLNDEDIQKLKKKIKINK